MLFKGTILYLKEAYICYEKWLTRAVIWVVFPHSLVWGKPNINN